MTPADFLAAVNAVAPIYVAPPASLPFNPNGFPHHSCPDQMVARLFNGNWTDLPRVKLPTKREPGQRLLHIVLVSPHTHEFECLPPFAPRCLLQNPPPQRTCIGRAAFLR